MNNRNLLRAIFLMTIALIFGVGAFRYYPIGSFSNAGAGLFPLMVSVMLFIIGAAMAVRSFFVDGERMPLQLRNIVIIVASLCGFALISTYAGMLVGTVFMTFCSSLASAVYSWKRCTAVSVGLVLIALALQYGLGLNMPLMPPQF